MTKLCSVPGCSKAAKGYSVYCNADGKRNIRHGHPSQVGITKSDLTPYQNEVRRFLDGRADPEAWEKSIDRLRLVAEGYQELLRVFDGGQPMSRWEVGAARMYLMVCSDADPKAIVETVAGMALMRERDPRRFASDQAFFAQLCRRFGGLTSLNCGTYWNERTQQFHRCYHDTPPRTAVILGRLLMETIGVIGIVQHRQEVERQRAEREASHALFAALAEGGEHVGR